MSSLYDFDWIFESFPAGELLSQRMFGGTAFYFSGRMVLVVMDSPGKRSFRDQEFPFDIWNGLLFPTEREFHDPILKKYPSLTQHPVLGKWLYLPFDSEHFDSVSDDILTEIRRGVNLWGIWPKERTKRKKRPAKAEGKISQLRNLGPTSVKTLAAAGIHTVAQLRKLGWQKAFLKVTTKDPRKIHLNLAYALIGALEDRDWRRLSAAKKREAQALVKKLKQKQK